MKIRLPAEMRDRIAERAKENGRSMNAEIIHRLSMALNIEADTKVVVQPATSQPIGGELTWYITSEIRELAEREGVPFDEMLAKIVVAGLHPTAPQVLYAPVFPGATREDVRAALDASDKVARPDAAFVSEMIQRAPWAPAWVAERLKAQGINPDANQAEVDELVGSSPAIAMVIDPPTEPPKRPSRVRRPAPKKKI
jgi:hypothetical protein